MVASPALAQELASAPAAESAIVMTAPCRLVDTRMAPPAVPFGGPVLAPGVTRSFAVGTCGVPADAFGVQLYVTVTETQGRGHLRVGPTGSPVPPTPSLNYDAAGRTLGIPVATRLGSGGFDVTAYASATHVVVDVVGYYSGAIVTSLNGATGALDIVGGSNVTVATTAGTITLDAPLTVGPDGPQGPAGPAGPTGATGPQGAIGPDGPQGITGATGAIGPAGPQGAVGATGSLGPAGPTGATGATGAAGPQGAVGATGPVGPAGPTGDTGATGSQGPVGPPGAVGPAGATGPAGPQGPAGPAGPAGSGAPVVKDANGVVLGLLLTQSGYGPTVLTSTGYQVTVPWDGNLNSLANAQMYFNNGSCTLATGAERGWVNGGNSVARPTQGKQAYWASTVGSYVVPSSVDANGVSMSAATTGVVMILNPTCSASTTTNYCWEVRKATMTELGLPATIGAPLQMPTP
jgi:hypothetical protein